MKKIDMQCHFYPREYADETNKFQLFPSHRIPLWESAEARIAEMDELGIERQVLSLSNPFIDSEDDGRNLYLAQINNDFLADVCHKYPERFSGFVNVPLGNINHSVDELKRALKKPGMLGVILGAHVHGKPLVSPEFIPFFEEANRLRIPIMLHPASPIGIRQIPEHQYYYFFVGFLWETTMAVGRMALSGIFERFQNIDWILAHLGGALPFVYTSMEMSQERNPSGEQMPSQPLSQYFRRLYADTARLITAPILKCAIDLYGGEHIVFGSDIPFEFDESKENIRRLEGFDLSSSLKEQIYYGNAKRLLKL